MLTFRAPGAVLLAALLWLGARGAGRLPPAGALLDPARGAWALAGTAELPRRAEATIPGLGLAVRVLYDDRDVPHIFAPTASDAWRALGYVTARDRLFQLELQARAGAGSLTELVGPPLLASDREIRELGMGRAAERLLAALPDTGESRRSLDAYAAGVNAYLAGMRPRDLPLEYRLLGRRPAPWSAASSLEVMLRMGYILASSDNEVRRLAAAASVGRAAADALFPPHSPIQEPIEPAPGEAHFAALRLPPPGAPDGEATARRAGLPAGLLARAATRDGDAIGSNNWAVAPRRTRAGAALLAGDPHLDLTLPSIWYEAHLVVPGVMDVYGVTIPGLPAVLIGFDRDVAWSLTNTGADVLDWWTEQVDDTLRPARYRLDGTWVPVERRIETYLDPHGDTLAVDTLRFTHRGPLRRADGRWRSMRWTVLEGGSVTALFHAGAHARTAQEWLGALAAYQAPAQNLLVADRSGTIAIRSTGRFPLRPGDGRGDMVHDGTTRASDWSGNWAVRDYPQAVSPAQGFLASANQEPRWPHEGDRYLGVNWPPPWRALRINALLRADSAVTPETMRRWQTDPGSARADRFLPFLLRAGATAPGDSALGHAVRLLAGWDRRYTRESEGPALFEAAMTELSQRVWDELPPEARPSSAMLSVLLDNSASAWWDLRRTADHVERRDEVLAGAVREGYRTLVALHGAPGSGAWRWSRVHRMNVWHLLHLPALSALGLDLPGGPSTLSPSFVNGGSEGASWRMVVELGGELRAWGTYPGGQSGNPASRRYDDRLPLWKEGRLAELRFPRRPEDVPVRSELTLRPPR